MGKILLQASEVDFVQCSDIFSAAVDTFRRYRAHDLSFVDAAIVTVARQHSPGFVATFGDDFSGLRGITVVAS